MIKSFVLLSLALGLMIFAQTCYAGVQVGNHGSHHHKTGLSDDDDDEYDDYEDDDESEYNGFGICTLLGQHACHISCSIIAHLFGDTAHGKCDSNEFCGCHNNSDNSYHQQWRKIFDAENVYRKLKDDDLVFPRLKEILDHPYQTAYEVKNLIQNSTTPYQFSKLRIREDNVTNKFTTKDGALDDAAVRKLAAEKMKTLLKTRKSKALLAVNYKDRFRRALESSDGGQATVYNCTYRVHRLRNQSLQNILDEYLKKNKIQKPKIDVVMKSDVIDIVDNVVINELIKQIDETSRNSPKTPKAITSPAKRRPMARLNQKPY